MQGIVIIAGLAFGAVIGLILSFVLLKFGEIIDRYPLGDEESRDKNWGSPVPFTRISVLLFWLFFIIGGWMVFQQSKVIFVGGIALLIGLLLFLATAVVFSLAVLNQMSAKKDEKGGSSLLSGKKSFSLFPRIRFPGSGHYHRRSSRKK